MSRFKVLLIYPNTPMATLLPIGVSSLSACLKQAGFDVQLFDTTYYRTGLDNFEKRKEHLLQVKPFDMGVPFKAGNVYDDLRSMVNDYQPDLIGISLVEDTIPLGLNLLVHIQEYNPKVPRIAGGVGTTFNSDWLINSGLIDIVFRGEAEYSLIDYIRGKFQNTSKPTIIGPFKPVDINQLPPPDFSIFESDRIKRVMHGKTYRMLHVELDRGCPYNCTYCCSPALKGMYGKGYYRTKTVDRLLREMSYLKGRWNPDYIDFNSETLLARPTQDLIKFMALYHEHIDVPFWCQSRPETVTPKKLAALKLGGVSDMQFGVEHGNEDFRRKWLNRKASNKVILNGLRTVEKYQIPYTVNNIIGWPEETRELVFDTINFNRQINPKTMNVYMMTPYKGTRMREYCEAEGFIAPDARSMQLLGGVEGMTYRYMTRDQFLGLQRTFPLFVKWPAMAERIECAEKFDEPGNLMFQWFRDKYIWRYYS